MALFRDSSFGFIDISSEFADLFLVTALFELEVEGVVLLDNLIDLSLVPVSEILDELIVLIPGALKGSFNDFKLPPRFKQAIG